VARAQIERFLRDVRRRHAAIAVAAFFLQREEFQLLADHHAVRHPQRKARADIRREGEKLHLLADLAMVALLRFLEPVR
jgi:NADH:ubiquinone oxidoreductase subunit C